MKSCEHNYPANSECPSCELEESKKYITVLEKTLLDLLDWNFCWDEIQKSTGLPEQRCREIEALYHKISQSKRKGT